MPISIQSITSRTVCLGFVVLALAFSSAAGAADNPLVGQWEPAASQPNQEVARNVAQLGRMEITPTHLAVFGESPVAYSYEQDGQKFHIKVNNPGAKPIDLVLRDPNTLLMQLPDGVDVLWQRVAVAAAQEPAAESPAKNEPIGASVAQMGFEMMAMMMPHSVPTRYEALNESLEALLNNGWAITQASGAGNAMALVLQHGQQHAICLLIGNPQDSQTGRSDCRRIN
jgi:hypothetical protein